MFPTIQSVRTIYRSLFIDDYDSSQSPKEIREEVYCLEDEIRDLKAKAAATSDIRYLQEAAQLEQRVEELSKLGWPATSYVSAS